MRVQSVIIDKKYMNKSQAIRWIKAHGYNIDYGIDEKEKTYRFRQVMPNPSFRYITKTLPGVGHLVMIAT